MAFFFTVYQTTHLSTGRIYIGCHKTRDLNDNYLGSGKRLRYAIAKYGLDDFQKIILFVFDNADEMFSKERELVNHEFISRKDTFNLRIGGEGGFDYLNRTGLSVSDAGREGARRVARVLFLKQKEAFEKDPSKRERWIKKLSEANKGMQGTFTGKKHTDEAKRLIGSKNSILQVGEKNSRFGSVWITDGSASKSINQSELDRWLALGWLKGRKMPSRQS
jgi:hypothetical protein